MPDVLNELHLRLKNLHFLYIDGIDKNVPAEDLKRIKQLIFETEKLILAREEFIKKNEGPNS